jgi:hypothetical protein
MFLMTTLTWMIALLVLHKCPPWTFWPGFVLTPIPHPRSDFDYEAALRPDAMDRTLKAIAEDYPMYAVDSDDEVLASDPYPTDI